MYVGTRACVGLLLCSRRALVVCQRTLVVLCETLAVAGVCSSSAGHVGQRRRGVVEVCQLQRSL